MIFFLIHCFGLGNIAYSQSYDLYALFDNGDFGVIDISTGKVEKIFSLSSFYSDYTGLTYYPDLDKFLVAVERFSNPKLISVDKFSGLVMEIGLIDQASPFVNYTFLEGMEFNPNDGKLYASVAEVSPPANFWTRNLVTIDPNTGNTTFVSQITGTCNNEADHFAFKLGETYLFDGCPSPIQFHSIDLSSGTTSLLGNIPSGEGGTYAIHPITGALFTANPDTRAFYSISTINGSTSYIGQTHTQSEFNGGRIIQIAFAPSDSPSVPTMTTWGFSLSFLLIITIFFVAIYNFSRKGRITY